MRPFQAFRFWIRRAPAGERIGTGLAALVVAVLVALLLVPDDDSATVEVVQQPEGAVGTSEPGQVMPEAAGPTGAAAPSALGGQPTPSGASGAAGVQAPTHVASREGVAASRCVSSGSPVRGIDAKEVKIAVGLLQIVGPAANSVFGVDPPDKQKANFEAVIAGINKEGGAACRTIVARYYEVNPVDEADMHAICLDVANAGVYAMVDTGGLASRPSVLSCFAQKKVPYFGAYFVSEAQRTDAYPYLYGFYIKERIYRSTAFALRDRGFFDPANGFKKLGVLVRSCFKESVGAYLGWLEEAGGTPMTTFDTGCPSAFASPAALQQAVLQFRQEGVTHVTIANEVADIGNFTRIAERQGFRPTYGFPDEALIATATGSQAPDPDNIANAVAITSGREGEPQTPGMSPTPGTLKCDAYLKAAGLPPTYRQQTSAGNACNQLWMLQRALDNAKAFDAASLAAGLQATRSIDFSYPGGPSDFTGPRETAGGQFWRVAQFLPECDCWRVVDREFHAPFT